MTRLLVSLLLVLSLTSCSNVEVGHYADQQPKLDLERFFSKPVKAGAFSRSVRGKWPSALRWISPAGVRATR